MQIMLDTNTFEDRDPAQLRALAVFLESLARIAEPTSEAASVDVDYSRASAGTPIAPPAPTPTVSVNGFSAAITPIPPPPGPQPAPELDVDGVVWDRNLHTSTKAKTIDGKWKPRKARGSVPAGTADVIPAAATTTPAPLPPPIPPPPPMVTTPPADDGDDEIPAGEPATPSAPLIDFPTFIARITSGMNEGVVTQKQITDLVAQFGLNSLFSLNEKPELVEPVARAFGFI